MKRQRAIGHPSLMPLLILKVSTSWSFKFITVLAFANNNLIIKMVFKDVPHFSNVLNKKFQLCHKLWKNPI